MHFKKIVFFCFVMISSNIVAFADKEDRSEEVLEDQEIKADNETSAEAGPPDSHEAMNNREINPKIREKRSYEFLMGLINNNSRYEVTKVDPSVITERPKRSCLIMGQVISYFGYGTPGRTDDPDPVTGLTSRDKYLVKSSYEKIKKDPTGSGVALLNLLFKNHPEYLKLFPFGNLPVKDLPTNKRYQAHGNAIIYAFSSAIDSLDQNDLLVTILSKIGESHEHRKITEQAFLDLKETLIELFSSLFTATEMVPWNKTLDVAFAVIIKAIKDERNKH